MRENKVYVKGISFMGALQLALIILKLCEVIKCSWWWVFAPVWINLILIVILFIICLLLANRGEK